MPLADRLDAALELLQSSTTSIESSPVAAQPQPAPAAVPATFSPKRPAMPQASRIPMSGLPPWILAASLASLPSLAAGTAPLGKASATRSRANSPRPPQDMKPGGMTSW